MVQSHLLTDKNYIKICSKIMHNGLCITFNNKDFNIEYPREVWDSLTNKTRECLKDNLAYATTMHLSMIIPYCRGIQYQSGRPLLEPYFFQNFIKDIPSNTEVDNSDTSKALLNFLQMEYVFSKKNVIEPNQEIMNISTDKAIIAMSFGKDSLLSFALAEEIGLNPEMVYVVESSLTYEEKHKTNLATLFQKEFGKQLNILKHETGKLRDYEFLNQPKSEFGWGLQSTEYALELLPFAFKENANFIIFGNEQSTTEFYYDNHHHWKIFPCYDQTPEWTVFINQITKSFSNGQIHTISLIEPIMDILIQRILIRRYPEYAKYQMSCFTESESGKEYRWCQACSVCGKMFLLSIAGGLDPKNIGFTKNMLKKEDKQLFTIFGGKSNLTYLNTGLGRDEQLFAFYLASKQKSKYPLVELFQRSELFQEAVERFEELSNTFMTIYKPITIPNRISEKVISIFKEEMALFEF